MTTLTTKELRPVKGMRDFYPDAMRCRNWLFDIFRRNSLLYGFEEYDASIVEHASLYQHKDGEEISEQMYAFADKSQRQLVLRPEFTPTLARMVMRHRHSLKLPLKWFTIGQCFRYERMTKGRKREHYQWNADIIGHKGHLAEVEILQLLITALNDMGLSAEQIEIRLNDRAIITALLQKAGVPKHLLTPTLIIIDKHDKLSAAALASMLTEAGLTTPQIAAIEQFLNLDSPQLDALDIDYSGNLGHVVEALTQTGFGDYLRIDLSTVRGLAYYTSTVFEVRSKTENLRAIAGGGRYDSLLSDDKNSLPAIGFGFGDVVITELLDSLGLTPPLQKQLSYVVIPYSDAELPTALNILATLRKHKHWSDLDASYRGLSKSIAHYAKEAIPNNLILVMPDELQQGYVVIRNLASHTEQRLAIKELATALL